MGYFNSVPTWCMNFFSPVHEYYFVYILFIYYCFLDLLWGWVAVGCIGGLGLPPKLG